MKKLNIGIIVIAVMAVALATTGFVYAQAPVTGTGQAGGFGTGMGGRGARGGQALVGAQGSALAAGPQTQDGTLHDGMIAFYAEKLGVSVDDLNARLANGETVSAIAAEKGYTFEQFRSLMTEARSAGIAQAVNDGTLTSAQADWMSQRGAGMARTAGNTGSMGAGRGAGGAGMGQYANPDCPFTQVNP